MAVSAENLASWEEIERSEIYLVSCMFEEASSLTSSIIRNLIENYRNQNAESYSENGLDDLLESAGMVLVQSLKELGRTLEILKELKLLFGSVTSIPALVFITGACLQISSGPTSGIDQYLEDFLSKWVYKDEACYISTEAAINSKGLGRQASLGVNEYLQVVDLYVITCLGIFMQKFDSAISWLEKAAIPEEKRQELLRRINSMNASSTTSLSHARASSLLLDKHGVDNALAEEQRTLDKPSKNLEPGYIANKENSINETILKLSRQQAPCIWWFRNITVKFGSKRLVVLIENVFMGCVLLLMCYYVRRKQVFLIRFLRKQAVSVKRALVDLWQLAFSYQVNPLAAVQPLPAVTRGGR